MEKAKVNARILMVDDEADVLQSMVRALRPMRSVSVSFATTAGEAMMMMERQPVDAVLVDWQLPDTSGDRLLRLLGDRYPGIPAGMVSGYPVTEILRGLQKEGLIRTYMAKPFSNKQLRTTVEYLLGTSMKSEEGIETSVSGFSSRRESGSMEGFSRLASCASVSRLSSAFSGQEQMEKYFRSLLSAVVSVSGADAGRLYTVEAKDGEDLLLLRQSECRSRSGDFGRPTISLDSTTIPAFVARRGVGLALKDVYAIPEKKPYQFDHTFDKRFDYRSKSLLVLPLKDEKGRTFGVLELINRKQAGTTLRTEEDVDRAVLPFDRRILRELHRLIYLAKSSLAGSMYIRQMWEHYGSFAPVLNWILSKQNPAIARHSIMTTDIVVDMACRINDIRTGPLADEYFSPERFKALRTDAALRDVKALFVDTLMNRMAHNNRHEDKENIKQRIDYALQSIEISYLKRERNIALREKDPVKQKNFLDEISKKRLEICSEIRESSRVLLDSLETEFIDKKVYDAVAYLKQLDLRDSNGKPYTIIPEHIETFLTGENEDLKKVERDLRNGNTLASFRFAGEILHPTSIHSLLGSFHEVTTRDTSENVHPLEHRSIETQLINISALFIALIGGSLRIRDKVPNEYQALRLLKREAKFGWIDPAIVDLLMQSREKSGTPRDEEE